MTTSFRFTLQPYTGPKSRITCPACGKPRCFTRYLDTDTDELLPDEYGRCDHEVSCAYQLNPYHRPVGGGLSYATATERGERQPTTVPPLVRRVTPAPITSIPAEVYRSTLGHYERNTMAQLLRQHFGLDIANELLARFHVGTSARWPGATVFWHLDELNRIRAGKIMLFADDWHRVKTPVNHIDWVPSALKRACQRQGQPVPDWLAEYKAHGKGCLFGLSQLATALASQPIAIVESEKTALLATPYFPRYVWLATGGLGNLTPERAEPLRGRRLVLFPDAGALSKWQVKADELQREGFAITVSTALEAMATPDERRVGLDLADVLLREWPGYPSSWGE